MFETTTRAGTARHLREHDNAGNMSFLKMTQWVTSGGDLPSEKSSSHRVNPSIIMSRWSGPSSKFKKRKKVFLVDKLYLLLTFSLKNTESSSYSYFKCI